MAATTTNPGARATARYLHVSPYKVRQVLQLVRGLPVGDAERMLQLCEKDAADDVLKVLLSASANAEHNHALPADELFVSTADSEAAQGKLTGRHHLAFQAQDRALVDAFYKAALAHGGKDNGAPGERPYHPGYYAAFVLDPDGNNIEAVFHGEAQRSSASVKITF